MRELKDLLEHEVKDLYSAEKQLLEALPKMVKASSNPELQKAFSDHLEETKGQFDRIQKVCDLMEINPGNAKCDAMAGLIEEGEDMVKEDATASVKDAGLIAAAQRVEHYEIAGYGTAHHFASALDLSEVASLLEQTLNQEKSADATLNKLAKSSINQKAMA